MKSLNSVTALLVGAILVTALSGCAKKGPKSPTLIPGRGQPTITEGNKPLDPVLPGTRLTGPTDPNAVGNNLSNPGATDPTRSTNLGPGGGDQTSRPDLSNSIEDRTVLQSETVYFDLDKATVKSSEVPKVERVATFLKNETTVSLLIEGNCDERGTEDYNRSLGERRALAIREVLVNLGIAPERVTTVTFGEDKPADTGHDEVAWAKNRRGDFVVLRPKSLQ
jgi:peptidoglycan-associated lipoprotein